MVCIMHSRITTIVLHGVPSKAVVRRGYRCAGHAIDVLHQFDHDAPDRLRDAKEHVKRVFLRDNMHHMTDFGYAREDTL